MNVVDKILTEWAYRCKKGYPDVNNPDDMKVLRELYSEYGIVTEVDTEKKSLYNYNIEYVPVDIPGKEDEDYYVKATDFDEKTNKVKAGAKYYIIEPKGKGTGKNTFVYKAVNPFEEEPEEKPEQEPEDKDTTQVGKVSQEEIAMVVQQLKNAGVPDNLIKQTVGTAKQPNPNFRALAGVEDFVKKENVEKLIKEFGYLYKYQILRGGKGELIPFVTIRGAKLGGPNEKDIVDSKGKVLEVKELPGKGSKREFALASGASVAGSSFIEHLQTFLKAIKPYRKLPHFRGMDKLKSLDSISRAYLLDLQEIIDTFPYTEKDLTQDTEEIKINGVKYTVVKGVPYVVELDDNGNLKPNQNAPIQAKQADVDMRKLLNHPWIKNRKGDGAQTPMGDLNKIRQKYLKSIDYLMLWTSESTAVVIKTDDQKQTKNIEVNRVATGNISLNYFVNK